MGLEFLSIKIRRPHHFYYPVYRVDLLFFFFINRSSHVFHFSLPFILYNFFIYKKRKFELGDKSATETQTAIIITTGVRRY